MYKQCLAIGTFMHVHGQAFEETSTPSYIT